MSYQVLARKWRPRVFHEMAGQEHVLQALINALDNDRLHHAYLFTGTRGVGKTTIARILAKCLNCEQGVSSKPCGECSSCTEINDGRFIDLIEVDAASNTKVEDTRELLDNVQYAPTRGRFKVYLIDEVHMLSNHSFNALLKTLEEPPPHIKFLLATTDPQKLPVTILSRCLQFNLKNLSPERITEHLTFVLGKESVPAEEAGVWALARSADGSMRDALSLTDQAIAHGGGKITEAEVNAMLGTIDRTWVVELCQAVAAGDGKLALAVVERMAEHAPDYKAVLGDMMSFWHRVAIAQTVAEALDNRHGDYAQVTELANSVAREDVQLFYQIGLLGRRDLPLAEDPRSAFEMVLLRQLAFKPGSSEMRAPDSGDRTTATPVRGGPPEKKPQTGPAEPAPFESGQTVISPVAPKDSNNSIETDTHARVSPGEDCGSITTAPVADNGDTSGVLYNPVPVKERETPVDKPEPPSSGADIDSLSPAETRPLQTGGSVTDEPAEDSWIALCSKIDVPGVLGNTAANLVILERGDSFFRFCLDENYSSLYEPAQQERLANALGEYLGREIRVEIETGSISGETPRMWNERKRAERQALAVSALQNDPLVKDLVRMFNGRLLEETVIARGVS